MADIVPGPDDEFDTLVTDKLIPYLSANGASMGMTVAEITELTNLGTAWTYAFTAKTNAEALYRGKVESKDLARAALEEFIRLLNNRFQANPAVTPEQKQGAGLPVHKTTRTASPVPSTTPSMQRIDTSTRGILRLFFVDATTPDSRAKPPGVQHVEIREQVGGTAPTNPDSMPFLANDTRPPYRADFSADEIGQTAYFAMRWVNTRGEVGPWSQIYSAVIPS